MRVSAKASESEGGESWVIDAAPTWSWDSLCGARVGVGVGVGGGGSWRGSTGWPLAPARTAGGHKQRARAERHRQSVRVRDASQVQGVGLELRTWCLTSEPGSGGRLQVGSTNTVSSYLLLLFACSPSGAGMAMAA